LLLGSIFQWFFSKRKDKKLNRPPICSIGFLWNLYVYLNKKYLFKQGVSLCVPEAFVSGPAAYRMKKRLEILQCSHKKMLFAFPFGCAQGQGFWQSGSLTEGNSLFTFWERLFVCMTLLNPLHRFPT